MLLRRKWTAAAVAMSALAMSALAMSAVVAAPMGSAADIPAPLVRALSVQRVPASAFSFAVLDMDGGRWVAGVHAEVPRSPASTMKLVTTLASLDVLGPAFTWHTRAWRGGELRDGVLHGDLYLQGGADPYLTLERWWRFAQTLRAQGLARIEGDIVIDDGAFALPPEDPAAFDGRPSRAYNLVPDALMVNFQSVEFRLAPNAAARRVEVLTTPAPVNLAVENRIRWVPGRCTARADRIDLQILREPVDRVAFFGTLADECGERTLSRVLMSPADYAYGTFVQLWRELGGEFTGGMRRGATPADARLLASFDSLSLGEIIRLTNKYSNNLMARHLLLTLGAERFGWPATADKGVRAVAEWSRGRGLDLHDAVIDNGAGRSRSARLSALQLARTLEAAYHSRYAPEFLASLPLAGIDGTLRHRLQDTPAGAVRLKTGHLDGVSGIAGFVTTPRGKTYAVASIINDRHADYGREPVHAALIAWMLQTL